MTRRLPAGRPRWSEQDVRALGVATDLFTAGHVLGIGRTLAHDLVRRGEWPTRLLRLGTRYRVPVADLLALLGLDQDRSSDGAA